MQDTLSDLDVQSGGVYAARRVHYGIWILLTGILTNFGCIGLGRFAIGMIIPAMGKSLSLTNTQLGIIVSGTFLGYLISTVVSGALATRFGPKKVIAMSLFLLTIAMMVAGLATNFLTAIIGQLLIGIGAGGGNVPTLGLVSRWYVSRLRGTASGLTLIGSGLGFALAGTLVPYLLGLYGGIGWRVSWFYLGFVVLLIAILGVLVLKNNPEDVGARPVGMSAESIEVAESPSSINSSTHWKDIYLARSLWELGFIYFMFGFSYVVFTTFFAKYLIEEIGFTQVSAGELWSAVGVISISSGLLWGMLSDKIGRRNSLFMVYILQGLCLLALALLQNPWIIGTVSLLYALTLWSIPSIMSATCADYVGGKLAPAAIGMVTIFFGVGQVMSPWISGYIKDATHSFAIPFMVSGGAGFIGALLTMVLPNNRDQGPGTRVKRKPIAK